MTTLTPTQPPVLCYEVYEYDNQIRGRIIDWKPYWKAIQDFEYHFDLKGREAHYVILSNDGSITRQVAIEFAQACHQKRVIRSRCDLTPCQPNRKK